MRSRLAVRVARSRARQGQCDARGGDRYATARAADDGGGEASAYGAQGGDAAARGCGSFAVRTERGAPVLQTTRDVRRVVA